MIKKAFVTGIVILFLGVAFASSTASKVEQSSMSPLGEDILYVGGSEDFREGIVILFPVFGFHPEVSEQNITYWMLRWWTITEQRFHGFLGNNVILGVYFMGGPL